MRYVQLRAFHHVAIHGGFSSAANALGLTQPAISDQVRKLEEEYDVTLFNRARRQVALTETGVVLHGITNRLFENEAQARELLTRSRSVRSGTLRIVADSAVHIVGIMGRFRRAHPGVRIEITSGNTASVIANLHAYEADIGVLGEPPAGREFRSLSLGTTPLLAFVAESHPLAGRESITLAELSAQALAVREAGSKTREKLEAAFAARGLSFNPAIAAEGREAVREIVSAGGTVGVISGAEFGRPSGLVPIALSDAQITMEEALVCLSERRAGKLVSAFFDTARDAGEA